MKCTGCGLPLSPQRTHCPRCGKAAGESEEKSSKSAETPQYAFPSSQANSVGAFQPQPATMAQQQGPNNIPGQPDQMVLPDQGQTLQVNPAQKSDWQAFSQAKMGTGSPDGIKPGEFRPFSQNPKPAHSRRIQSGFTVAGLCVLSGGLILVLVYLISLSLPPLVAATPSTAIAAHTPASQASSPASQAGATVTPTLPLPTPTPGLPGKVYIDNAQMGSSLNLNTAQLSQTATTFTVNQKIFVTFVLHPLTTGGAVCLNWYVDQKQFSEFSFAVGATSQQAYSFAFPTSAGSGSVSIYWASSPACTDKILAQVARFTVTP
jgi:hypothetical protein